MTALISSHINEPENLTFPSVILARTVVHLCAQKTSHYLSIKWQATVHSYGPQFWTLVMPDLGCKARLDIVCKCSHTHFPVLYLLYYITI